MKKILLLMFFAPSAVILPGQYKPVEKKSEIRFTIRNFGIEIPGTFTGPEGNISFDPKYPEKTLFNVSVQAETINTDNSLRDSHLKNETYFDTQHYPAISFISNRVVPGKNGLLTAYGILTIKNHSKEVPVIFTSIAEGDGYLFKGQLSINRRDFDIGGASIIADTATVSLSVYASKE